MGKSAEAEGDLNQRGDTIGPSELISGQARPRPWLDCQPLNLSIIRTYRGRLSAMKYRTRQLYYLRTGPNSSLQLVLYIDPQHVHWMKVSHI